MQLESQLQSIQCDGSSFSLDISQLPFFQYIHNVCPYWWNFLEGYFERQDIHLIYASFIRGDTPPQTIFSNLYLHFTYETLSLTPLQLFIRPRTNQHLRLRLKAQYTILGPYPYSDFTFFFCKIKILSRALKDTVLF